jgi:hypothetical protein
MRDRPNSQQGPSNDRASATCSGMMTEEVAELMDLSGVSSGKKRPSTSSWMGELFGSFAAPSKIVEAVPATVPHEYVRLEFRPSDLEAMKAYGMQHCCEDEDIDFVSTNDMVTAFGWLLKRQVSGNTDWNISMVVNLRGQASVNHFSNDRGEDCRGVFGNGITNVYAATETEQEDVLVSPHHVGMAAMEIRRSLMTHRNDVSDRVLQSRIGQSIPIGALGPSFATTSWTQFPLWSIGFTRGTKLSAFHGFPSHPLPTGETFSSVILPRQDRGCTYKLLLPSGKSKSAFALHRQLRASFRDWYKAENETRTQ